MKSLVAALAVVLASCSSGTAGNGADATFPAEALETTTSESGALRLAVRTSPQPPPRGTCQVELTITDASSAPVDGLVLDIVPWMTAHGHGTSVKPIVTPKGNGRYLVTDVNVFMPGTWELRTSISGTVTDHADPTLDVP